MREYKVIRIEANGNRVELGSFIGSETELIDMILDFEGISDNNVKYEFKGE